MNRILIALAAMFAPMLALAACSAEPPAATGIEVRDAWARATAPGQNGAIYATIVNHGDADRLVRAESPRAAMAMLHSSTSEAGVARMRMVAAVEVPAGASIALAPGGTHVMLEGLGAPLVAGEKIEVTFHFAGAGAKAATATVTAPGAR